MTANVRKLLKGPHSTLLFNSLMTDLGLMSLPITSAQVSTRQRHESGRFACLFDECTGCPGACLRFVRIFRACFNVVFRGQKICLRYFKIGQTYFEICALYFFFSPMWGKRTENQFSIFCTENARFCGRVFQRFRRDKSCPNYSPGKSATKATKMAYITGKACPQGK